MHVCLATPEFPPVSHGGIATYHGHLARILHRAGHRVTVLTVGAEDPEEPFDEARVVRLGASVEKRYVRLEPVFGPEARAAARSAAIGLSMRDWLLAHAEAEEIEVVEAPEFGGAAPFLVAEALPALVVACHGGTGQVQTHTAGSDHSLRDDFLASLELAAVSSADAVLCYGRQNREDWERYLGRTVHYAPPPFLSTEHEPLANRPADGRLLGVAVGRMNNWKGVLETAEALAACRRRGVDLAVLWVGRDQAAPMDGIDSVREHLARTYPELWGTSFLWQEELTPPETRALQAAADFALVPSRWDTFNFTAPEAMSVGTPLVVSTGAGASDLCRDGENALVVPPGDVEALADAMERMADPMLRKRLGQEGRDTVGSDLAPQRVVDGRLPIYVEAVDRHRDRARLGHASSLMNPLVWQWMRTADLTAREAVAGRLPSGLIVREALRRLRRRGPAALVSTVKSRWRLRSPEH